MTETNTIDRSYEMSHNLCVIMEVLLETHTIQSKEFVKLKGEQLLEQLRQYHSMIKNY